MAGHAGFVWSAYAAAALVLLGLLAASFRSLRVRERELAALEAEAPRRRRPGAGGDG